MKQMGSILILALVLSWLVLPPPVTVAQQPDTCAITLPVSGSVLRGQVTIKGTAKYAFQIGYAPDPNPSGEWKFFANGQQAVENGQLGIWDTRSLPDGLYQLIIEVFRQDGNKDLCFMSRLTVNNTAPTPTFTAEPLPTPGNTPTPRPQVTTTVSITATAAVTVTSTPAVQQPPTATPRATPTYSPVNNPTPTPGASKFALPIELGSVRDWSCRGAQFTLVIALVVIIYFVVRNAIAHGVRQVGKPRDVEGFHRRRPRQY